MAAHKLHGRVKLYGFEISIENAKGSVRRWYDPHGKETGSTKMYFDYGYIRKTRGTDGDHVDVYIGPNPESDRVFIVNQMKKPPTDVKGSWTKFDEQKVMLAFKDAEAAKAAYLKQYDDPRFFGGMKELSVDDFKTKVLDRENHGKKIAEARLLTELNLMKIATGEPIVLPTKKREVLGADAGVESLPPVTPYAEATMSKDEREAADREIKSAGLSHTHESTKGLRRAAVAEGRKVETEHTKDRGTATQIAIDHLHEDPKYYEKLKKVEKTASGDRAGRIADRIDDVGIGLLAAPYAADAGSRLLMRAGGRNAKVRAAATALKAGFGSKSHFGHSAPRELAGLAMVAPGVTHTIAKGIDKAVPQKTASGDMLQYFQDHPEKLEEKRERDRKKKAALEKIAQSLFDDYEYKTEAEKTAILGLLGRAAGGVARAGGAVRGAVTGAGTAMAQGAGKATSGLMGAVERASTQLRGGFVAGQRGVSQQVGERAVRMASTPGSILAKTAPAASAVQAPVAAASKWNPMSARNVLLGGAATGVGLAGYTGYKGVQTASNILSNHHEMPLAPPGFVGTGRAF